MTPGGVDRLREERVRSALRLLQERAPARLAAYELALLRTLEEARRTGNAQRG
jgi:hypothetical protein